MVASFRALFIMLDGSKERVIYEHHSVAVYGNAPVSKERKTQGGCIAPQGGRGSEDSS